MQPYPRITTFAETVVALSALIAMVLGVGAIPFVQAEVAVFPGVIVIEQLLPAVNVVPQLEEDVVPLGKVG